MINLNQLGRMVKDVCQERGEPTIKRQLVDYVV